MATRNRVFVAESRVLKARNVDLERVGEEEGKRWGHVLEMGELETTDSTSHQCTGQITCET